MTSLFSRRHYEAIAAVVRKHYDTETTFGNRGGAVRFMAKSMADLFQGDNPRFDRARFMQACGLTE